MLIFEFVLVETIVFLIVFFVLRRMMVQNTTSAVNRLKTVDEENARRLEEMKKKISEAKTEYDQKSAELAQELEKQSEEAKKQIEEEKAALLAKSREESDRILNAAKSRLEKMEEERDKECDARAAALSRKIVSEALSGTIKAAVNEQLVDELLREFAVLDIGHVPEQTNEAEIIIPHPFSAGGRKKVQEILEKKIGRKVNLKETVKQGMIGGMILKLGSLVLDGSLENKLDTIATGFKKQG